MAVTRSSKTKVQTQEHNCVTGPVPEKTPKSFSTPVSPDVTRILRSQKLPLTIQVDNSLNPEKKESKSKTRNGRMNKTFAYEPFIAVTTSKENFGEIESQKKSTTELNDNVLEVQKDRDSTCSCSSDTFLKIENDEEKSFKGLDCNSFYSSESEDDPVPDRYQSTPNSLSTPTLYFSALSSRTLFDVLDRTVDYITDDYLEIINLASTLKQRVSKLDALQTNLLLLPPNNIKLVKLQNLHTTVEVLIDALAKPWKRLSTLSEKDVYLSCPFVVDEPVYEDITELEGFEGLDLHAQDDNSFDDLLRLFQ